MDSIKKEQVVAGVIGGFTALALAYIARKYVFRRKWGKGGRWGPAQIITMPSTHMPAPIGPYSFGKMIQMPNGSIYAWSSGQLGLKPDGNLADGDDPVVAQAEQVLENLKNLANDNGMDLEKHCVKNVVYLVDMGDFAKVNAVYTRYFKGPEYPARTCIAVKALPKGGLVEIESVFFKPNEPKACKK
jgi:2-iminobutanoate/2-iminopropanoate deaminase